MRVVISQSMFFPWVGMLEQVRLADVFVHYDDVQFSKGSLVNRVQLKTAQGMRWMTVPTRQLHLGHRISEVEVAPASQWQPHHLSLLDSSLGCGPWVSDAIGLVRHVFSEGHQRLGSLARSSLMQLCDYFDLSATTRFVDVESLGVEGSSSERVLQIVKKVGGTEYVTGHGAARYLDHSLFDAAGIEVRYMKYRMKPYLQSHGEFTPFVSGLDLVAHCGRAGREFICSETVPWREFLDGSARAV